MAVPVSADRQRELYQQNPEKFVRRSRDYRRNNPEKYLLHAIRARSKRQGIECNITEEDIVIPTHCPILGVEMELFNGHFNPKCPTVDRIDNSKGYIKGNVAVISWRANKLKADASLQELEALYFYTKERLRKEYGVQK